MGVRSCVRAFVCQYLVYSQNFGLGEARLYYTFSHWAGRARAIASSYAIGRTHARRLNWCPVTKGHYGHGQF